MLKLYYSKKWEKVLVIFFFCLGFTEEKVSFRHYPHDFLHQMPKDYILRNISPLLNTALPHSKPKSTFSDRPYCLCEHILGFFFKTEWVSSRFILLPFNVCDSFTSKIDPSKLLWILKDEKKSIWWYSLPSLLLMIASTRFVWAM